MKPYHILVLVITIVLLGLVLSFYNNHTELPQQVIEENKAPDTAKSDKTPNDMIIDGLNPRKNFPK